MEVDLPSVLSRKGETILFVDDEEPLRHLGKRMLSGKGYQVLLAASGEEALALFQEQGEGIDLVILDLSMPGMGGAKCLTEMLALNPQTRVIIITGYSPDALAGGGLAGAATCVRKPFSQAELLETVDKVLYRSRADALPD